MATTSRTWINPPIVVLVTNPSSQSIIRTTQIVHNILFIFRFWFWCTPSGPSGAPSFCKHGRAWGLTVSSASCATALGFGCFYYALLCHNRSCTFGFLCHLVSFCLTDVLE